MKWGIGQWCHHQKIQREMEEGHIKRKVGEGRDRRGKGKREKGKGERGEGKGQPEPFYKKDLYEFISFSPGMGGGIEVLNPEGFPLQDHPIPITPPRTRRNNF